MEQTDKKVRKGICRCIQYKKEIYELKELVKELRIKEAELDSIKENLSIKGELEVNESFTVSENTNINNEYQNILKYKNEKEYEFVKEKLNPEDFTCERFNEIFERNNKKHSSSNLNTKITETLNKNYNPNILPVKHISGYEKFDNDAFNKEFDENKFVSKTDSQNLFSPW